MRIATIPVLLFLVPTQFAHSADIHELFDTFDTNIWGTNHGYSNGSFTATYWLNDHASISNGNLVLTLDETPCSTDTNLCGGKTTASAEIKTLSHFNYGEIEARMKVAKGDGLVTALFKYTGGHEGNPQEEIDFEVLGKDPTKLQINYFVNGQGGHEKIIDLGFDASADFHTYKYIHLPTSIEWYVDDTLVHGVYDVPVPAYAGRIYMNLWAAQPGSSTAQYWAGNYQSGQLPAQAEFAYIDIISYPDAAPPPPPPAEEQPYVDQYDELNVRHINWHLSDNWSNGFFTATGWRADHGINENGTVKLLLDEQPCASTPAECSGKLTASAELSSKTYFGYGTLEGRLKAATGEGLVTALFKYTGPSDGTPQEEIDMEILGKDPTKIQLNYFVNGQGGHEVVLDLGFDASTDFHRYGFTHTPDYIEWYVDGNMIYRADQGPMPSYPARIFANLWAAQPGSTTATYWAGTYDPLALPAATEVDYINVTQGLPGGAPKQTIAAKHSQLPITVQTAATATAPGITQQIDDNSNNQHWYTTQDGEHFRLKSWVGNQCLSTGGTPDSNVELQTCTDSDTQRWRLPTAGQETTIVSVANQQCLDVELASTNEGAAILTTACSGADSQLFTFSQQVPLPPPPTANALPTPLSPLGPVSTPAPEFRWMAVTDAVSYKIWASDFPATGVPQYDIVMETLTPQQAGCLSSLECSVAPNVTFTGENSEFYVEAYFADGTKTTPVLGEFTVLNDNTNPPVATQPTPLAPIGNTSTNTPEFSWMAVSDAVGYKLWASDFPETGPLYNVVFQTLTPAEANCDTGIRCSVAPNVSFTGPNAEFYIQALFSDGTSTEPLRSLFNPQ